MKYFVVLFFSLLFFQKSFANDDVTNALATALKSYQDQDFEGAKNSLDSQLQNHSNDSVLLYNLGLVEYKLGKVGLALAYWRKALYINPSLSLAKEALDFAMSQSQQPPMVSESSTWGWIYSKIISLLSFHIVFPIFLILFLLTTRGFSKHLGERKKALLNDDPLPQMSINMLLCSFLTVVFLVLASVLFYDLNLTKATITKATSASVRLSPSVESGSIYEIPEGTQVIIRDTQNGWYKIEDPLGRSGWADQNELFITTGNK